MVWAGAGRKHELGVIIPAFDADIFIMNIPDLPAHLLKFQERVVIFPASNLRADAVSIGQFGRGFAETPLMLRDFEPAL